MKNKIKLFLIFAVLFILFYYFKETFSSSVQNGARCETNSSEIRIQNGDNCTLINCNKGYKPDYKVGTGAKLNLDTHTKPYDVLTYAVGDPAYPECKALLSPILRAAYDQMSTGPGFYTDAQILSEHPEAWIPSKGCYITVDPIEENKKIQEKNSMNIGACVYTPTTCELFNSSGDIINNPHGFYTYNTESNCNLNTCDINYNNNSSSCNYSKSTIGDKCIVSDFPNATTVSSSRDINNTCVITNCKQGYYIYNNTCLFDWSKTDFAKSASITQPTTTKSASISFKVQGDNPNRKLIQVSIPLNLTGKAKMLKNLQDFKVTLTSVNASMTKNGSNFTIFTTTFPNNISKNYKITNKTDVSIQQPFTQLNLKFTPDDSRNLDTYSIKYTFNYTTTGKDVTFTPNYSGSAFGLNLAQSKTVANGIAYINSDGAVSPFKIMLSS